MTLVDKLCFISFTHILCGDVNINTLGRTVRQKLPDNLKSQFRSFVMLPLDSVYIIEMILFANGFKDAKRLARKLVQLEKLCAHQLSHAEHYDYSVRTTKSIVSLAKSLKRQRNNTLPPDQEAQVILKAIYEVNLPKLIPTDDLTIFKEICMQIFSNTNVCTTDTAGGGGGSNDDAATDTSMAPLQQCIKECFKKRGWAPNEQLLEKIQQLYKLLDVNNGIIIVGDAMSGKTMCWQLLADALRELKALKSSTGSENGTDVVYRVINPKSVNAVQLFEYVDPDTGEWAEGVIETVYREMMGASSSGQCRGWVVFDGIIDPMWAECMHILLDSNRKLCLPSGEMIEKTELMAILFETDDLQFASPSTVSRCGIVYIHQSHEQWKSLHLSFVDALHHIGLIDIYMALYEALVDWLMPATLEILNECQCTLAITAAQKYKV